MAEPRYIQEIRGMFERLDERTINTFKLVEKLEKHQAIQNNKVEEQGKQVTKNTTNIKWVIRILSASGIIGGITTGIIKGVGG